MFRFNPRSRCNSSSRCWYRAREHVDPAWSRRIRHGGDSDPEMPLSPGSVGLARAHPLKPRLRSLPAGLGPVWSTPPVGALVLGWLYGISSRSCSVLYNQVAIDLFPCMICFVAINLFHFLTCSIAINRRAGTRQTCYSYHRGLKPFWPLLRPPPYSALKLCTAVFVSPGHHALLPGSPHTDDFHVLIIGLPWGGEQWRLTRWANTPKYTSSATNSQIPRITPLARNDM